ncbi:hypothetical protein [Sphingomonas sp.]|jgi:hypothetical protein|uniref:hypothetical protein n=1 Tax=Sphingomonas sp. TaxID=28214 RepID=UPI002ED8A144
MHLARRIVGGRIAATVLLLALALHPASALPQSMTESADNHITVTGRLRKVGINYALRGRQLKVCVARRRGEDAEAVRLMCRILRACALKGYHREKVAQQCVSATLDELEKIYPGADTPDAAIAAAVRPPDENPSKAKRPE